MQLTEAGVERFEVLSGFLMIFLASSAILRLLWNGVGRDLAWLPRLSRWQAVTLVTLAGLVAWPALAVVGRGFEPIVPPAWRAQAATDNPAGPVTDWGMPAPEPAATGDDEPRRRAHLEELRGALWGDAGRHGGRLPASVAAAEFAPSAWITLDPAGMRYGYVGGGRVDVGVTVVAFEPGIYGPERLVLLSDGSIRRWTAEALATALGGGK